MGIAKAWLVFNLIVWLSYGIACLLNPALLTEFAGIAMTTPTATTEIRAMYGGVQSAMGLLALAALLKPGMVKPALAAFAFVLPCLAASRTLGLLLDASASPYTNGVLVFEWLAAAVAVWVFLKKAPAAA
jgi:hypothetical protein